MQFQENIRRCGRIFRRMRLLRLRPSMKLITDLCTTYLHLQEGTIETYDANVTDVTRQRKTNRKEMGLEQHLHSIEY